ncbi:hypothetical protein AB1L42_21230 [Thalassoglobus sp. JC818]|uniref:hypothetical protein n=1 Tax=Thalassoglobus sp. JC818 TaxID=3232136 RepID=UPI0034582A1E
MVSRRKDDNPSVSLHSIQIVVFLVVNFLLWGVAAGIYNGGSGMGSARRSRSNVTIFVVSSVATIPEVGSVIPHIWRNHKWYVVVFVVIESFLVLFLFWMKKVDEDMKSGNLFRKRK